MTKEVTFEDVIDNPEITKFMISWVIHNSLF